MFPYRHFVSLLLFALVSPALAQIDFDAPTTQAQGKLIYTADFTEASESAVRESGGKGTIEGVIHPDWSLKNSANFLNRVTATVMEDDGLTQGQFWRVESIKIEPHNRDLIMLWSEDVMPAPTDNAHLLRIEMRVRGTAGVRVRIKPSRSTATEFVLTGSWQDQAITLPVYPDKKNKDAKFNIHLDVDGSGHGQMTLDLAKMEVRMVSSDEVLAATLAALPAEGHPANLMRTSRFPLGLPFGWTPVTRDYPSIFYDFASDPKAVGPSGFPTLKVTATSDDTAAIRGKNQGTRFTSSPLMVLDPSKSHVFSTYVKGKGTVEVSVRLDWKVRSPAVTVTLDGSDEWQRVEVPFQPVVMNDQPLSAWFAVDTKKGDSVWFDAMQLELGEAAQAYQPQLEAEVQLGIPQQTKVQFDGDDPIVRWATTGAPAGSVLRSRVVDVYGQTVELDPQPQDGKPLKEGEINYLTGRDRVFGQFRVESWIENNGKRISPYDEVVVTRVRQPHYWGKDAPNSPFAGHFDSHPVIAEMAKSIGMNWVRDWDSAWKEIQPTEDAWRDQKDRLRPYRDAHISVMPVLSAVPKWAELQVEGLKPADYPREVSLYGDFVERFLEFHKGNVQAIEVFNEPWIARHFNQGEPLEGGRYVEWENPYQKFDDLTAEASQRAAKVAPEVQVVGINTNQANREWTEGMLSVDGLKNCDVASYHMYALGRGIPGDNYQWLLSEALSPIIEAKPKFPIWMTEGSPTAHNIGTGLLQRIAPGDQQDEGIMQRSDRHVRYALTPLAMGVDRIFYYTMGGGRFYQPTDWGWRVLMDPSGSLMPEAAAFSNMAWHLEDANFVRSEQLDEQTYVYLFEYDASLRDAGAVGVIVTDLASTKAPTYRLPTVANVTGLDIFGNPLEGGSVIPSEASYVSTTQSVDALMKALRP